MVFFKLLLIILLIYCFLKFLFSVSKIINASQKAYRLSKRKISTKKDTSQIKKNINIIFKNGKKIILMFIAFIITLNIFNDCSNYSAMEAWVNSIDKRILSIAWKQETILDPIDYQKTAEKDEEFFYEEILLDIFFYEDCGSLLIPSPDSDCFESFNKYIDTQIDIYGNPVSSALLDYKTATPFLFMDISPEEIRSVDEITFNINQYSSAQNVPVKIYKEELYARILAFSIHPIGDNAYQVARAADDILNFLVCNNGAEEEVFYFASIAFRYYMESLKFNIEDESRNDILLKMAKVLQNVNLGIEDFEYKNYFILLSNAFLSQINNYSQTDDLCYTQYNYYYGISQYNVSKICNIDSITYYESTLIYLERYIKQVNTKPEFVKSCKDRATTILNEYPQLTTLFWKNTLTTTNTQ